jgi:hypothetical protein
MSEGEALYLALAIGAALVFAATLAWVSRSPLTPRHRQASISPGQGLQPKSP